MAVWRLGPLTGVRAIRNYIIKLLARIFIPGIAKAMQEEGGLDFSADGAPRDAAYSNYIHVVDNGSDVTIFSLAGAAVLFAGMPQFEFQKLLAEHGRGYNLVFLRDPHRSAYTKAPDGTRTGLDFFGKLAVDTKERLGSRYNVALGASAGGAAAFYMGSLLSFEQVIAFSPGFPQDVYINRKMRWRTFLNVKKLFTEPKAYFEVVFVTLAAMFVWRLICRTIGEENVPDVTKTYLASDPRPRATIIYGERCAPDRDQALRHAGIPGLYLRPVDSGRHNCAADLKKRGMLGTVIMEEIDAGLTEWRSRQVQPEPALAEAEG